VIVHNPVMVEPGEGQGFARKASLGQVRRMIFVPFLAIPHLRRRGKSAIPMSAMWTVSGTSGNLGGSALKLAARALQGEPKQEKSLSRSREKATDKNVTQLQRRRNLAAIFLSVLSMAIGHLGEKRGGALVKEAVLKTKKQGNRHGRGHVRGELALEGFAGRKAPAEHMRRKWSHA